MNRRDFLGAIVAGIASTVIPTIAIAEKTNITPSEDPNFKYRVVCGMLDYAFYWQNDNDELHATMKRMLDYIDEKFCVPTNSNEEGTACFDVLSDDFDVSKILKHPPEIIEAVWPVAVMRLAMRDWRLPISPLKIHSEFRRFQSRYGVLIMSGPEEYVS